MTEYKHPNGTIFAEGQVWGDGNNEEVMITRILPKGKNPIKTLFGVFTKTGRWHGRGKGDKDLKTLLREPDIIIDAGIEAINIVLRMAFSRT